MYECSGICGCGCGGDGDCSPDCVYCSPGAGALDAGSAMVTRFLADAGPLEPGATIVARFVAGAGALESDAAIVTGVVTWVVGGTAGDT